MTLRSIAFTALLAAGLPGCTRDVPPSHRDTAAPHEEAAEMTTQTPPPPPDATSRPGTPAGDTATGGTGTAAPSPAGGPLQPPQPSRDAVARAPEDAGAPGQVPDSKAPARYRVRDNGVRCITFPCPSYDVIPEDGGETMAIHEVDLAPAGLGDKQLAMAQQALQGKGLEVTGRLKVVAKRGPAGDATVLEVQSIHW